MTYTTMIIRGEHHGESATVTFVYIGRKIWNASLEVGGKRIDVRGTKDRGLRPCPTHAGYLLDEHFPSVKRRVAAAKKLKPRGRVAKAAARHYSSNGISLFDGGA